MSERDMILSFFNEASQEELTRVPGCSKKKSEVIMEERPFKNWEDLVRNACIVKRPCCWFMLLEKNLLEKMFKMYIRSR